MCAILPHGGGLAIGTAYVQRPTSAQLIAPHSALGLAFRQSGTLSLPVLASGA